MVVLARSEDLVARTCSSRGCKLHHNTCSMRLVDTVSCLVMRKTIPCQTVACRSAMVRTGFDSNGDPPPSDASALQNILICGYQQLVSLSKINTCMTSFSPTSNMQRSADWLTKRASSTTKTSTDFEPFSQTVLCLP